MALQELSVRSPGFSVITGIQGLSVRLNCMNTCTWRAIEGVHNIRHYPRIHSTRFRSLTEFSHPGKPTKYQEYGRHSDVYRNSSGMYISAKMLRSLLSMVVFATRSVTSTSYSIQDEGNACSDMAAAMPGLKAVISKLSSMLVTLLGWRSNFSSLVQRMVRYCWLCNISLAVTDWQFSFNAMNNHRVIRKFQYAYNFLFVL